MDTSVKRLKRLGKARPAASSELVRRVRRVREGSGIHNYAEFARALGIKSRTITSELESGKTPSQEIFARLANFAAHYGFLSDAVWFLKKASIDEHTIFAAGREALKEREGVSAALGSKVFRLPVERKTPEGFEETGLSVELPNVVSDTTRCIIAENDEKDRDRFAFAAGKLLVIERLNLTDLWEPFKERDLSRIRPYFGDVVLIEFSPSQRDQRAVQKFIREQTEQERHEGQDKPFPWERLAALTQQWEAGSKGLFLGEITLVPPGTFQVSFPLVLEPLTRSWGETISPPAPVAYAIQLHPEVKLVGRVVAILPKSIAFRGAEEEDESGSN